MAGQPYLVLARKWRPQSFEDVVGQEHITRTLQNAIAAGRIGHAFLFIGSRGIGKTTTARVLAKALNCLAVDKPTPTPCGECGNCTSIAAGNNLDVMEIDGASNNSVDNVREIREHIRLSPSHSRYKIYVIDEVHQLSPGAFNALLKTLEEPPNHAIFILATTEARKLPATIVSRCQRYDFRRVSIERVVELLRRIVDAEGISCSDEALQTVARAADGGVRDAESILEQVISYCSDEITFQEVNDVLGLIDWQVLHRLSDAIRDKDVSTLLNLVEEMVAAGKDLSQFLQDILQYYRNLLVCKTADPQQLLFLPDDEIALMQERAGQYTLTQIIRIIEQFADLARDFDSRLAQRIALETLLIRMSKVSTEMSIDAVLDKLIALEEGGGGQATVSPESAGTAPQQTEPPRPERPSGSTGTEPRNEAPVTPRNAAPAGEPASNTAEAQPEPAPQPRAMGEGGATHVSEDNMAGVWARICRRITEQEMALGFKLSGVQPERVDCETLVVSVAPHNARARGAVEDPASRALLEECFRDMTANIRTIRCEVREEKPDAAANASAARPASPPPAAPRVEPEAARQAMEDPHVARVLDVFKGRIVDIKPPA